MKRRILVLTVVFSLLFSNICFCFPKDTYFQDLRIGLENMMANSIEVIFNGNYKFGDNIVPSGTSYILNVNENKININGIDYDNVLFVPENSLNTLTLKIGPKVYNYLGSLEFNIRSGNILPINIINVEDYLKGVVPYEMSNSYPIEALKAQAISARNYALSNKGKHSSKGYDLCDTIDCQVYRGYNENYKNAIKAIEDTRGMVLLYNDAFAETYYSASNGGYTEASGNIWNNRDYLKVKTDEYDNELWPYGDVNLTISDIDMRLKSKGYLKQDSNFIKIDLDSIKKNDSMRVSSIDIIYKDAAGIEQRMSFTKERTRTFLSLPSSSYDITYDENTGTYTFKGKGYGHGVGLSQIGAKNRATAGQAFDSILTFYYDGTYLINILNPTKDLIINKNKINNNEVLFATYDDNDEGKLYKYTIEKDEKVVFVRDYLSDKTLKYTPNETGNYKIHLYIKYNGSNNEYDEEKVKDFVVSNSLETINKENTSDNTSDTKKNEDTNGTNSSNESAYPKETTDNTQKTNVQDAKPKENTKPVNTLSISRSLTYGAKGSDVKALQSFLKILGYKVDINGTYDKKTLAAVKDFQKKNKINPSGTVGVKTVAAINKSVTEKYKSSSVAKY